VGHDRSRNLFDFTNGFHDTANAIATSISTRALSPHAAVGLSAVFNLVGAVITVAFFQAKVSNTIASTLAIKPGLVVVMSALLAPSRGTSSPGTAVFRAARPTRSSEASVARGIAAAGGLGGVKWSSLGKQVAKPRDSRHPWAFFAAALFAILLISIVVPPAPEPAPVNRTFRGLQVLTAAFLSYSHGANDAQKTMAAITLALIASGDLTKFQVPLWVVVLSAVTIAFVHMQAAGGSSHPGLEHHQARACDWPRRPIHGRHRDSGRHAGRFAGEHDPRRHRFGDGSRCDPQALRGQLGLGANIALAWLVTIPAAAIIAWVVYAILHTAGLRG